MSDKKESHEDFMKRCMGKDFWERSETERFEAVLMKCLNTNPVAAQNEIKRRAAQAKEQNVPRKG